MNIDFNLVLIKERPSSETNFICFSSDFNRIFGEY